MIRHSPSEQDSCELLVDGVSMKFSRALNNIKLGDYGHFTDSKDFRREGNLLELADPKSLSLNAAIIPRQHKIYELGWHHHDGLIKLYKPLGLSLPSNDHFKSFLLSLSTRLTNRYLVTRVIQCPPQPGQPGSDTIYWYNFTKPLVWHRNEGAGSVVGGTMEL
ncbi:hypothetical protein SCLCIDRAFT_864293 [Scleroderma citrinum Foug A]|uniref:Uncharacterized protein n=1 Tax=Scleroderma citrinum Foug A TaxID=1036808 RepID=A0A0C3A9X5_9AGAM|nr:hypothetical protein SCLCIDRAFT_864293 [Scleroderma citrinum Foug A]